MRHQGGMVRVLSRVLHGCSAAQPGCTHLHTSTLAQHIPATLPTRGCTIACLLSPLSPAHMHKQCLPSSQQLPALASTSRLRELSPLLNLSPLCPVHCSWYPTCMHGSRAAIEKAQFDWQRKEEEY